MGTETAIGVNGGPGDLPAEALIDQLPTGLVVIDRAGIIGFANRVALDTLGWRSHDHVGRSLIDVVVDDDLAVVGELLADAGAHFGSSLGPMRIRYDDGDGRSRSTELWARELADRSGYVLVVPEESGTAALADATRAIADGEPIERAMTHIVRSLGVHPLSADGCVLRMTDTGLDPLTPWPLDEHSLEAVDRAAPWLASIRSGLPVDAIDLDADVVDLDRADPRLAADLERRGYGALWCRPVVDRRGVVSAVVLVLPSGGRRPTVNQRRRFDEVVATVALAFDQLEERSTPDLAAFTDPLTGAGTRTRLEHEVEVGISRAAVLYIDLDGFQDINDTYGHGAGDRVLREVARRLDDLVRPDDLVIRVGGDEFVLVVRAVSEFAGVQVAARAIDELSRPYDISNGDGDAPLLVSAAASVGLCVQCDGTSFDLALQAADEALSSAKQAGRHRMHVVSR